LHVRALSRATVSPSHRNVVPVANKVERYTVACLARCRLVSLVGKKVQRLDRERLLDAELLYGKHLPARFCGPGMRNI
jgi:hypothetical protein